MVGPDSRQLSRDRRYLGDRVTEGFPFRLRDFHPLWPDIPDRSARLAFVTPLPVCTPRNAIPATPDLQRAHAITQIGFRLIPFRSPLLGESNPLSFPAGTEMFHFPAFASRVATGCTDFHRYGFPHSEIPGSKPVRRLPGAYRSRPRPSSPLGA